MTNLVFSGVSGMDLPYNIWGCDIYGNNCITGTTCNPGNTNLLSDAKITINLIIDYDISCVSCDLPSDDKQSF